RPVLLLTLSSASMLATLTSNLVFAFLLNRPSDFCAAPFHSLLTAPLLQPTRCNSICNRRGSSPSDGLCDFASGGGIAASCPIALSLLLSPAALGLSAAAFAASAAFVSSSAFFSAAIRACSA